MKIAFVSDIHGNFEAFSAVLSDIYSQKVTTIISLGDIVGYGPNPNECIKLAMTHCNSAILGNHDAAVFAPTMTLDFNSNAQYAITWTSQVMTKESLSYLNSLPMKIERDDFTAVHATPYDPHQWYYITSIEDALFNFNFFNSKLCFTGHTHIPGIIEFNRTENDVSVIKPKQYFYEESDNYRYIVNVGSVGQPRDKNNKACYVILDTDKKCVTFHRIAYDIPTYQSKMESIGMPKFLISRVEEGR